MDRIAVRTTRESCIFGGTSYLLSKTWGKCYGIDPWFDHIHDQKRYHMIMGINHRVKKNGADMTNKIKDILKTHKYLLLSFFLPVLLLEGIAIAERYSHLAVNHF